ncbi:MAG: hypothetical protein EBY17_01445 [Acidobacteriia bacterium]|nr:hypothetical protein [Terriglobia bacterium]
MRLLMTIAAGLALSVAGLAQDQKTQIKKVPAQATSPASGVEMFRAYCAACHGLDAKGTGPAASALKMAPANLTLLMKKNNGKSPILAVQNMIQGDNSPAAHGSRDMPMRGDIFRAVCASKAVVDIRIRNLRDYIESLQEK